MGRHDRHGFNHNPSHDESWSRTINHMQGQHFLLFPINKPDRVGNDASTDADGKDDLHSRWDRCFTEWIV